MGRGREGGRGWESGWERDRDWGERMGRERVGRGERGGKGWVERGGRGERDGERGG